jgi:hypothetical protein
VEVIRSCEASVHTRTRRRNIPENGILQVSTSLYIATIPFYSSRSSALRPTSNLEGQVPVCPPSDRTIQLYPQTPGSLFIAFLRLAGLRWRYSNPPPHGDYTPVRYDNRPVQNALSQKHTSLMLLTNMNNIHRNVSSTQVYIIACNDRLYGTDGTWNFSHLAVGAS